MKSFRNGGACKANKDQEWWSSRDGGHGHARQIRTKNGGVLGMEGMGMQGK